MARSIIPTFTYELRYMRKYRYIAGVDEVGVAPLAGPVVAAAVILDPKKIGKQKSGGRWWSDVRDSKMLSSNKREELAKIIFENCLSFGLGSATVSEIDEMNILQARLLAMKRAVMSAKLTADFILVDGDKKIVNISTPQLPVIRGDQKILSIACASIIAKVTRDNILRNLNEKYPEYGFAQHKGYPTKMHQAKLKQFGPCEEHRKSFAPVRASLVR